MGLVGQFCVQLNTRVPIAGLSRFNPELQTDMFSAPTHVHACMIQQSLREFVANDPKAILQVIYVPLRPGQQQSRELFQEIIELDQLLLRMGTVLFFRFFMATVIVDVEILARRTQGFVPKVVPDQAQVDLLIRHMLTGCMSQPVCRGTLKQIRSDYEFITALP